MARPRGNPNFMAVRHADTTAATHQLQLNADRHAVAVYQALLAAIRGGEIDHAADGNDKALWRAWLNANGHLTQRQRPWSKKSFNRMLSRLKSRGLLVL
ncbi:hypothetical protein [Stenotrophomonas acidaminiphila]|uniref:hypothetical protein n=1 Tax=Stenotrophomonas acidaminiphila TaxID=128780 RepID=UPI0028AD2390|nr:hypothetical protein [Stenotrophomonas acidaminiphila]